MPSLTDRSWTSDDSALWLPSSCGAAGAVTSYTGHVPS